MDKYFVKRGKKYVPAGYSLPDLHNGFYFHQKEDRGSRTTSILYWLGSNCSEPVDLNLLVKVMKLDEKVSSYIMAIQDKDSPEYAKLVEDAGGYVKDVPKIYNISAQELAVSVLRIVYEELKNAATSPRHS